MPDRRAEREQNPHVAPQQCVCIFNVFICLIMATELHHSLFLDKLKFTLKSVHSFIIILSGLLQ